ncbi:ankyrin repeat and protein kinase domain-containing protein 1 [Brachyhypopomus gauderio]|uniref:ankyrin repeat and protein kinase domain-containing protein 1 n=1 Tax=Brachyhypopomus gauderio TaxID=698409 RepID=UPI0040413B68
MAEPSFLRMDNVPNGRDSLACFKKEEFEVDWDKVSERRFGRVYKVKHKLEQERRAVKTFSSSRDYRNMLQVSKIRQTKSKYLVSVYGFCKDPPAVVMDFMNRGSLDNLLTTHVLMWPKKFQMIHEVAMGMEALHSMEPPLLHLNLKLANILLDDCLHVKLSDFGLIKWEDSSGKTTFIEHLTARGNIVYVPPEAFVQYPEPPTSKYDVYSFSIVMWEILSQSRPYPGMNLTEILIRVSSGKRPSLEKIPDDKPQKCDEMLRMMQQCWHHDSSTRPAFTEMVWKTEALSDELKLPDTISGGQAQKRSRRFKPPLPALPSVDSDDNQDANSDGPSVSVYSYLKRKDFKTFKKVVSKEHVSLVFKDNNSLLHHAVASGDVECVRAVLDVGGVVNCQSSRGHTPLAIATLHKSYDVCALLIQRGAAVDLGDNDLWTPLHFAAQAGDDRAVRLLLDAGATSDVRDGDGWTPLHLACQNGHEGVVRHLLLRSEAVDVRETCGGRTPLQVACAYGHLRIAKLLLARGADPNAVDAGQATPLHLAADEGHFRVARLLLSSGACADAVDGRGYSALHLAASRGCTGICRLLLGRGEDPDVRTRQGWTPMHLAALKGHPDTVLVLRERGGTLDSRGEGGWTPLHLACHHGREEAVTALLSAGADPNLAEKSGWTALHLACRNGASSTVLRLIAHRADVNAQNDSRNTPLHLAAHTGSPAVVRALLTNHSNVDLVNAKGLTALAIAQQGQNVELVQLLSK